MPVESALLCNGLVVVSEAALLTPKGAKPGT